MIALFDHEYLAATRQKKALILHSAQSNEWYTPPRYIKAARALMGDIDVDPASCREANQVVQAKTYYDLSANGLDKEWRGRVWLNPPYGYDGPTRQKANISTWIECLIAQYDAGITTEAVLLVNATTEKRWFDPLWQYPICFASVRISFWNAQGENGRPTHGNALIYFGKNESRFIEVFSEIGPVVKRIYRPQKEANIIPSLWIEEVEE